jgi:hypothetical protein
MVDESDLEARHPSFALLEAAQCGLRTQGQTLGHPGADTLHGTAQWPFADRSEACVAPLPLGLGPHLQGLSCLSLAREDLDLLLAFGANEAPVAHQPDRAEQIPLDHQAEEACPALRRITPIEHQMVP